MSRLNFCLLALLAGLAGGLFVVCSAGPAPAQKEKGPKGDRIVVDKAKRTITIPAKIAPRKIDNPAYKGLIYPIEVIATYPYPRGKKAHETVVTIEVKPSDVHKALVDFGLRPGAPAKTDKQPGTGPEVKIFIDVPAGGKAMKRIPIEKAVVDRRTNLPMPKVKWRFTGSVMSKPNPEKPAVYGADVNGTLIAIFPVTDETVFQSTLTLRDEKFVKLETDKKLLPPEGTAVKLVIVVPRAK
jgi:hypothetical protein